LRGSLTSLKLKSGSTDIGVLYNKGKLKLGQMMSLTHISDLYSVVDDGKFVVIGARASLDQVERATAQSFKSFSDYLHIFASVQIKNSGTLVGNLMNASPIADTIPFLRVAEAEVVLQSMTGERILNINSFIKGGYKELDIRTDEIVTHVKIPKTSAQFKLFKVSNRKDLDISTVTLATRFKLEGGKFTQFALALGGVGATVLRMPKVEAMATGELPSTQLFQNLANEIAQTIKPLSDVRGSAEYRRMLCQNLMLKFGDELLSELTGTELKASV
jgi:xanthine dehydrogenase small subunit